MGRTHGDKPLSARPFARPGERRRGHCIRSGVPRPLSACTLSLNFASIRTLDGNGALTREVWQAMRFEDYAISIAPISEEEGGGYLVTLPDLPGCIADGETIDAAIGGGPRRLHRVGAMAEREDKGELPPAKNLQRTICAAYSQDPTYAARPSERASEGVSLNQLAATLLAQGLGSK